MNIKDSDVIIELHDSLVGGFGGEGGLISKHLLISALSRPFLGLSDGTELYPTIVDKSAALLYSLVKNHAFLDGNKRTAGVVTLDFLLESGYELKYSKEEFISFILGIAKSEFDLDYIKDWVAKRISKI